VAVKRCRIAAIFVFVAALATPPETTTDDHLVALDAKAGKVAWDQKVQDYKKGQCMTFMPLVMSGKVLVGGSGGECCRERCRDRTNTRHVGTQSNGYSEVIAIIREIVDRAVLSLKDAGVPSFLIE
jgi:outer membrane protein assembly factor BamB